MQYVMRSDVLYDDTCGTCGKMWIEVIVGVIVVLGVVIVEVLVAVIGVVVLISTIMLNNM